MSRHVFADETKDRDYLLIATVHTSGDLDELRKLVRGLVLPGQYRVHMKKENDSRKRLIASTIVAAAVTATVYDAGRSYRDELDARAACLAAMIDDATDEDTLLVLEQDDSLIDWDRRHLYGLTRQAGLPRMRYEHRRASAEPLLAIPDAIAWCWAKGGDWRRRIQPAVTTVHRV